MRVSHAQQLISTHPSSIPVPPSPKTQAHGAGRGGNPSAAGSSLLCGILAPLWDSPSLLCGILAPLCDGSLLLCIPGTEQARQDPTAQPRRHNFHDLPKKSRETFWQRELSFGIFSDLISSVGGKGRSEFFSCVFSNIKITERFL